MSEYRMYAFDDCEDLIGKHMSAMTGENLHDKGEIATELAWRDYQIQQLQSSQAVLLEALENIADGKYYGYLGEPYKTARDIAEQAVRAVKNES